MPAGKEFKFDYTIQIPNGLEFNKEAFSDHGVYFSLTTEAGKYRTKTEPNKIGFRIAEKYALASTFNSIADAPSEQHGTLTYNFRRKYNQ